MKINQCIYEKLLRLPNVPPETGGILGSKNGEIDTMILDVTKPSCHGGIYVPNVSFLNECIAGWNENGIVFQGIFHTHALNWPDLSSEDKEYIVKIMNAMPDSIQKLYFPLVFPSDFIRIFSAERKKGEIFISEESGETVQEVAQ